MTNKKILVVEDHDLLLLAIRDILEGEGYEVRTAIDGVDGLEQMQDFFPDLIIADISMPRMDGYRFFEEVHSHPEWVPIPFIFLTARAEREDRLRGKAMGAEDYIIKPFDPEELVVVVSSRIGRAQAIRAAAESEFEELKQQIVTVLSHELRTPLTSVYGYTELALEEAASLPAGDFQQFLGRIKKGADRLTRLVEDLMLVVRMDTGELDREFRLLGPSKQNLAAMIDRIVEAQAPSAQRQGVNLHTVISDDIPEVQVHEYFIADALSRLIDNAIKFSRNKGGDVTVSLAPNGDWVEISVQDKGVGIAEDQIPHLFRRFGQINRSKMEQQGTGLGLVITKALVECMGGQIAVESTLGEGSTFTIRLPASIAAESTDAV